MSIPTDTTAEREVIGTVVASHLGLLAALRFVTAEDFHDPAFSALFAVATQLHDIEKGGGRETTIDDVQWHAPSHRMWGLPRTERVRAVAAADLAGANHLDVWEMVERRSSSVDGEGRFAQRVLEASLAREQVADLERQQSELVKSWEAA